MATASEFATEPTEKRPDTPTLEVVTELSEAVVDDEHLQEERRAAYAKDEKGNALGSDGDPQVRNNRQGCCQDCPDKYRRCGQFERNRQTGNEPDESLPEKTEIDHCLAPHPARRAILGEAEEKRRDHGDCQIEQSSRDKELKRSAR